MFCNLYLTRFDLTNDLLFDTFFMTLFTNSVVVITKHLDPNDFTEDTEIKVPKDRILLSQARFFVTKQLPIF